MPSQGLGYHKRPSGFFQINPPSNQLGNNSNRVPDIYEFNPKFFEINACSPEVK
jgi:hypothetical protein